MEAARLAAEKWPRRSSSSVPLVNPKPLRLIPSRDDHHRHAIKHHIGLVVSKFFSPLIFASYTPVDIRNALPIIPLTFRNQRVECFSDFLLTEFGDELSKLVLDFTGHQWVKLRRKSFRVWANTYRSPATLAL